MVWSGVPMFELKWSKLNSMGGSMRQTETLVNATCTLPTKSSKSHPPPRLLLRAPGSAFHSLKRMPSLLLLILSMWVLHGLPAHQLHIHIPWQQGAVKSALPFEAKGVVGSYSIHCGARLRSYTSEWNMMQPCWRESCDILEVSLELLWTRTPHKHSALLFPQRLGVW